MKTRSERTVLVDKPTDAMKSMVSDCRQHLDILFHNALALGARNEWILFVVALYDARTRRYFRMEAKPEAIEASVFDTRVGKAFVTAMPIQVCDEPIMQGHPYFDHVRTFNRAKIGTDIPILAYAFGQTYVGILQGDFDVRVMSRVVDGERLERMERFQREIIPRLRAVLAADAQRLGVSPCHVAYSVHVGRNADSGVNLNETEFLESGQNQVLTMIDTYPLEKFVLEYSKAYENHPEIAAIISAPVEPGCFRVMVQLFGNVAISDWPVVNPHSIQTGASGLLS